jgi:hypothetical protein
VSDRRTSVRLEELLILKRRFGMSAQALLRRMSDLAIISPTTYKWSGVHLSKLGYRKQEPQEIKREASEWLRQAGLRSWAEGFITQQEAERLAGQKLGEKESPTSLRRHVLQHMTAGSVSCIEDGFGHRYSFSGRSTGPARSCLSIRPGIRFPYITL